MKLITKTVAVIGLGYVGLPLALLADQKGYKVIGIDIDQEKIDKLNKKQPLFVDNEIAKELKKTKAEFTTDFSRINKASIIIICVPTPVFANHMPNLGPVRKACGSIGPNMKRGQLVILESTVNPGVSDNLVIPLLEKNSGLKAGKDFYLVHCPERINPGDKNWNVKNIPRVIGSLEKIGLKKAVRFYKSIIDGEIRPMGSLEEAEAVKIVENSFRDINIAFVNELAKSFSKLGIDVVRVIDGAATKPFAFMAHYPGCGVGGHCIPVDPYYLIEYAKRNGFSHDLLVLARKINNSMPKFVVEKTIEGLNEKKVALKGTKVAVLGLAYKADIGDCRESPSFDIIRLLKEYGANVVAFDPYVPDKSDVKNLNEVLRGAKAVIVATAHKKFKKLTPKNLLKNGILVTIDGRNCLSKHKFKNSKMIYKGIGT